MTMHCLEADYRGARLKLEITPDRQVCLFINGILREKVCATGHHIRVSSTVQTDYEWHEFIEGRIEFTGDGVSASLLANATPVAEETFTLESE